MVVGWTGENQGALQRCKDSQLIAPVGTSASETGNSMPFYINLILGCREEKAYLQCCLKTHLQIVGVEMTGYSSQRVTQAGQL